MTTRIRILTACFALILTATEGYSQKRVVPVPDSLAPANPHGPKPGPGGSNGTGGSTTGNRNWNPNNLQPNPQATRNLFIRLGLVGAKREATGKLYAVHQNGARGGIIGSYVVKSDGRMMVFVVATDIRLDFHSAVYNPRTNVVGAKWTSINLRTARNLGGGGINMSLNGTGPVYGEMQEWYMMVGNHVQQLSSPRQRVVFIPN